MMKQTEGQGICFFPAPRGFFVIAFIAKYGLYDYTAHISSDYLQQLLGLRFFTSFYCIFTC